MADYKYIESFYVEDSDEDVDTVRVSIAGRDGDDKGMDVVSMTFTGNVLYYDNETGESLELPQSEDFLQQFAAVLGYRVVKGPE